MFKLWQPGIDLRASSPLDFARRVRRKSRRRFANIMLESLRKSSQPSDKAVSTISPSQRLSPVYSDRFVYGRQPLLAREMCLLQSGLGSVVVPRRAASSDEHLDFMPIYKLAKPSAAGIFYNAGLTRDDELELRSGLEPSILLVDAFRASRGNEAGCVARQPRHHLERGYSRISERGASSNKGSAALDFKLNIAEYEFVARAWPGAAVLARQEDLEDEQSRTSLLMLEPLLLVSSAIEPPDPRAVEREKERLAHEEQMKLLRIVVAYFITFVVLLSVTFYIVYFR